MGRHGGDSRSGGVSGGNTLGTLGNTWEHLGTLGGRGSFCCKIVEY